MSDTQAAMREFRFLDEKRKTTGLTSIEEQRWNELATQLGMGGAQPQPAGYWGEDGQWYAYPQGYDPNTGQYYDPNAGYYDPNAPYDPNAAAQQGYDPSQYPQDPYAQQQPYYDPNTQQYYDPNAGYQDPNAYAQQQPQQTWQQAEQSWEPLLPADPAPAPVPAAVPEPAQGAPREIADDEVMEVSDEDVTLLDPSPSPEAAAAPKPVSRAIYGKPIFGAPERPLANRSAQGVQPEPRRAPQPDLVADLRSSLTEDSAKSKLPAPPPSSWSNRIAVPVAESPPPAAVEPKVEAKVEAPPPEPPAPAPAPTPPSPPRPTPPTAPPAPVAAEPEPSIIVDDEPPPQPPPFAPVASEPSVIVAPEIATPSMSEPTVIVSDEPPPPRPSVPDIIVVEDEEPPPPPRPSVPEPFVVFEDEPSPPPPPPLSIPEPTVIVAEDPPPPPPLASPVPETLGALPSSPSDPFIEVIEEPPDERSRPSPPPVAIPPPEPEPPLIDASVDSSPLIETGPPKPLDFEVEIDELPELPAPPVDLSGSASDRPQLASTAEFLDYGSQPPAQDLSSFSTEPDAPIVENAPLATLANQGALAQTPFDEEVTNPADTALPLATNADFLTRPELQSTGQTWKPSGHAPVDIYTERETTDVHHTQVPLGVEEDDTDVVQGIVIEEEVEEPTSQADAAIPSPELFAQSATIPVMRAPLPQPPPPPPAPPQPAVVQPPPGPAIPNYFAPRPSPGVPAPPQQQRDAKPLVPGPPVAVGQDAFDKSGQHLHADDHHIVVRGEHRVILHTLEGQVKRGAIRDADLAAEHVSLEGGAGGAERIPRARLKAIFFMLPAGTKAPNPDGQKVRVTFKDGRQVAGFSKDHKGGGPGFFVIPADNRTNTSRIFIFRHSVQAIAVD